MTLRAIKPKIVNGSLKKIATAETVAALPPTDHLHPICLNPSLICTDTTDGKKARKYSSELWREVVKRVTAHCGDKRWELPPNPTSADRAHQRATRANIRAHAIGNVRWLLVADCVVGEPDLMTGQTIYCSLASHQEVDDDGKLVSIIGAKARRIFGSWGIKSFDTNPRDFIDVTHLFWDQYLRFGRCAKNDMGFREINHEWIQVTRNSKRCACCDMWSYRRIQRTVVKAKKHDHHLTQERTITQVPVWEHQVSRIHADPYFHVIRNHLEQQG